MCSGTTSPGQQHQAEREQREALDRFAHRREGSRRPAALGLNANDRDRLVPARPARPRSSGAAGGAAPTWCRSSCSTTGCSRGRHRVRPADPVPARGARRSRRGAASSAGRGLVVRHGGPSRELAALAREAGADAVHFSADVSPFARARGERVAAALDGVELHAHPGLFAADAPGDDQHPRRAAADGLRPLSPGLAERGPTRAVLGAPRALAPLPSGSAEGPPPRPRRRSASTRRSPIRCRAGRRRGASG